MKFSKITSFLKGQILSFLSEKWSFSLIIKHFKKQGIDLYPMQLSRIKNEKENFKKSHLKSKKKPSGRNALKALSRSRLSKLKKMTTSENPVSQRSMADRLGVSQYTINYHIHKTFQLKKYKKRKVHHLNEAQKLKRYKRSWRLYLFVKDNLEKIISSDEKIFTLNECNQKSEFQYLKPCDFQQKLSTREVQKNPKSIMVWAGISKAGRTNLYFVEPGAKINATFYQETILTSLLNMIIIVYTRTVMEFFSKIPHRLMLLKVRLAI